MGSYGFPRVAEDAASASGDALMPVAGVRKDGSDTALTGADGDYTALATNDVGCLKIQAEPSRKATYAAATGMFTAIASATDMLQIYGSATKTIKILKIFASYTTATASSTNIFFLIKRSADNSNSQSPSSPTKIPLDSAFAAATAIVRNYATGGTNPTVGAAVGNVDVRTCQSQMASAYNSGGLSPLVLFDADKFGAPIVLRGVAEGLVVNNNGATPVGTTPTVGFTIIWTEE